VNKICTFLLSGQLVASMFNLLAGNFQHVQLATALAQLRTGADHRCLIYTGDEMRKILEGKNLGF